MGSLYFSQIRHFSPCLLCWTQRIFLYPLAPVLGFMLITRNKGIAYLVLGGSLLGQGVSVYHYLLQKTTLLAAANTCGGSVPCSLIYIDWWGVVTIPLLAMTAFMLITLGVVFFLAEYSEEQVVSQVPDRLAILFVSGTVILGATVWLGVYFEANSSPNSSNVGIADPPTEVQSATLPADTVSSEQGDMLFQENCAVCHGQNGVGIPTLTPSLQSSERVRELNIQALSELIQRGVPQEDPQNQTGNVMPPGGGAELNDSELQAVVAFLKSQMEP